MPRVKRGVTARARHKKVLDEAKGGRSARPRQVYLSLGSSAKNDPFVVTKVNGPNDNPTSVEVRFADSTETATISKEKPFRRVAGHEADMAHEKDGDRRYYSGGDRSQRRFTQWRLQFR